MYRILVVLLLSLPLSTVLSHPLDRLDASERAEYEKRVAGLVYLDETASKCPTGFVWNRLDFNDLEGMIRDRRLAPDCLWDIMDLAGDKVPLGKIYGFSWGVTQGVSLFIGVNIGTELVVMKWDDETLIAGMFRYEGGTLDLSLPGFAYSQSIIHGNCQKNILSYRGIFQSSGLATYMIHEGKTRPFGKSTGCDAVSHVRGISSPAAYLGINEYETVGKFVFIQGPKAEKLIKYIDDLNERTQLSH